MTPTPSDHTPSHARRRVVAGTAVIALSLTAFGATTGATTEPPSTDAPATSAPGEDTTTTVAAGEPTTTVAAAPTTTGPATASSEQFTATLAAACEGDTGHPLLAAAVLGAVGTDGSLRVVEALRACDAEFVGAVDEALGRPTTNLEALIADPVNNVTPNQAQLDLINAELTLYWRIANTWAQAQAGSTAEAPADETTESSAPDETATTGG